MAEISALCRKGGIPFGLFAGDYPRLRSLADGAGFAMVDLEALRAADLRWKGVELSISRTNRH